MDSWHMIKRAWLLEEHIMEERLSTEKSQILLFDLDGTLLRNDKTISEYTLEILSKCREYGYLIGISTSRGEQNCLGFLRKMKPDILISSGGALVRVNEKIICSSSFSAIETKNFIESARKICGMDCEITVDTLEAHYWNYRTNPKEQDKSWGNSIYTDFTDFKYEALKICVEIYHPNLAQKLCKQFSELDSQRFSDGDWYKFTKSGITKEKAILAEYVKRVMQMYRKLLLLEMIMQILVC